MTETKKKDHDASSFVVTPSPRRPSLAMLFTSMVVLAAWILFLLILAIQASR